MLNKIRGINILGVSPFSSRWGENPLAVPQIPKLAKGTVTDRATLAMIGEAGKEAVIPLERNTQGLDLIADKLSERIGGKGFTVNNYNTFNGMATTRYALHTAQKQGEASWKLLVASRGGV